MGCIEKIYSVSALVGSGACNGNCKFCAGKYLRGDATQDVTTYALYKRNLEAAIKLSARYGGWSLSLTSSGEPTCSPEAVTDALRVYKKCADQGAYFPNVNVFTNGILLGDKDFCDTWLPIWRDLGLTNVAVSIHSVWEYEQARVYGVNWYPPYETIRENVERHGVGVRATLLLQKKLVDNAEMYDLSVNHMIRLGYNNITSWPVGNPDGSRNEFTISRWNLFGIRQWLNKNAKLCHEHSWSGGIWDYNGNILRLTDYVTRHDPKKDFVRQLVVWQTGEVTYSWIKNGALCLK